MSTHHLFQPKQQSDFDWIVSAGQHQAKKVTGDFGEIRESPDSE